MFKFRSERDFLKREFVAALTTFFTMSYILIINPKILGDVGIDYGSIFSATAIVACIGSILMGIFADRPFALASGMGLNAYFAYSVIGGMDFSYGAALAAVFAAGTLTAIVSFSKLKLGNAAPESFKHALIGGLGLFLVFIGMQNAHFIVANPATLITLGNLTETKTLIAVLGLFITMFFVIKRIEGALFLGIIMTSLVAMLLGMVPFPTELIRTPPPITDVFMKIDFGFIFDLKLFPVIFTFFIIAFFDNFGTLTVLGNNPKFWSRSEEKKATETAMGVNSFSSMLGAAFGVPTVVTYLENASGIHAGGKSGLVAIFVGLLFFLSLFFFPLIAAIPIEAAAPVMILVGLWMFSGVGNINYSDQTETIPALLTLGVIPFTYSIASGIELGSVSYVFLKLVTGRRKEIHPAMYFIAFLSLLNFSGIF